MNKTKTIALLVGGSFILIFFCTIAFIQPAFIPVLDLSKTGQIGDTIGGIAAPIVGILGSILVYLSFKEQLEANKIQRESLNNEILRSNASKDLDIFLKLYSQIEGSYNDLEFHKLKGLSAVETYIDYFKKDSEWAKQFIGSFESNFDHLVYQCLLLFRRSLDTDLPDEDKKLTVQMLVYFYKNKMNDYVIYRITSDERDTKKIYLSLNSLWEELLEFASNSDYKL